MTNKEKYLKIQAVFDEIYKDAKCSLDFDTPFQLLVATMLSAQCTDARVNMVTPALFKRFPDVKSLAGADTRELEDIIRSTGFFRNKAKNIKGCAEKLLRDFGGAVPDTMDELLSLPGVGRKTANLILGDVFGKGGVVVDTHAGRIAGRLGFTKHTDPVKVERDLLKIIPVENQTRFCHQLVHHGRTFCPARKPKCASCPAHSICHFTKP